jgi:hypothetical protein
MFTDKRPSFLLTVTTQYRYQQIHVYASGKGSSVIDHDLMVYVTIYSDNLAAQILIHLSGVHISMHSSRLSRKFL